MKTATLLIKGRNIALMQTQRAIFLIFSFLLFYERETGVEGSKQAGPSGEILPSVWMGDTG